MRSSLYILQGTLTARRYVDDILTPIVLPMLSSRPGAIYQQDKMLVHIYNARLSQQCLQGYDVLPWPKVTRSFANRACLEGAGKTAAVPRYAVYLTSQMQRLWQDLPQGVINDLIDIDAMPNFGLYSCQRWLYYLLIFNLLQAVTA
ncbi:DDE_3 domain-containing protein [Trichonephila clavipes]|uniref:DDE_3 domain-containing protein n=1 Tax=Trichonephila clavipes TaxID=2585209 RepID=A0A8X6WC39_TRICX|nr:DDE_3 domain-containing protein [Trichonephila clavipes]